MCGCVFAVVDGHEIYIYSSCLWHRKSSNHNNRSRFKVCVCVYDFLEKVHVQSLCVYIHVVAVRVFVSECADTLECSVYIL